MKKYIILTTLTMFYFFYGFYVSQLNISANSDILHSQFTNEDFDYRGVINVQTDRSTGSSSVADVVAEAKIANLDFMLLTDKNPPGSRDLQQGYNGNLLVIDAAEFSFLDSRLLYWNRDSMPNSDVSSQLTLRLTDELSQESSNPPNRLIVLARPFNPQQTWTGEYPPGLDGLEVLNPKTISERSWEKSKLSVIWSLITYPFNPKVAFLRLFQEPIEETALWDRLSQQQHVYAYAGSDANARAIPVANYLIHFPSYSSSFNIVSNHILLPTELTGNYDNDVRKIMHAFKKGHFYLAIDLLGDPRGFSAKIWDRNQSYQMGEVVPLKKGLKLISQLPNTPKDFFEIVLLKNGERVHISNTQQFSYEIKEKGVYRVVVRVSPTFAIPDGKRWLTWIYSNPFFVE